MTEPDPTTRAGVGDVPDWSDIAEGLSQIRSKDPHVDGAALPLTDIGNAQRIKLYLGDQLRWVDDQEVWRRWTGKHWEEGGVGILLNMIQRIPEHITREARYAAETDAHMRWARDCGMDNRINAMMKQARGMTDLYARSDDFDQPYPHLLNTTNCTLELDNGLNWHEHDIKDYITHLCPTAYDPTATSPLLDNTLYRFIPNAEERRYIIDCLAVAALSPENSERKLLMLIGPSSTGKSTIMDLTMKTLGRYASSANTSILRGNLDERPRPDMLSAMDSWLITLFEASNDWQLHADQIKRITGQDLIKARTLHSRAYIERPIRATPIIICNEPPHIKGADEAISRRLLCLIMDATPAGLEAGEAQMREILVRDEGARRAWLAQLIQHYVNCGGQYPADVPHRFALKTAEIFEQLDDVAQVMRAMIEDRTVLISDTRPASHYAKTQDIWKCYIAWVKKYGTNQQRADLLGSAEAFGKKLRSFGYEVKHVNGSRVIGHVLGDSVIASNVKMGL